MATNPITWDDKVSVIEPGIRVNQWQDADANEVKEKHNLNDLRIDDAEGRLDTVEGAGYDANPKSLDEIIAGLILANAPTYTAPTLDTLDADPLFVEVGESASIDLDMGNFVQNDGGAADKSSGSVVVKYDGSPLTYGVHYDIAGDIITVYLNITGGEENHVLNVEIPYAQGALKQDGFFGDDYATGRVASGSVNKDAYIAFKYKNWYGAVAAEPTDSSGFRSLNSVFTPSGTLNTGTTYKDFIIVCSDGLSLDSVIDTDVLGGLDITDQFSLIGTITSMNDAEPDSYAIKVYYASVAAPYSTSHAWDFTLI